MNKNTQIFELYIDYLVTSFCYTTATGLSSLLDGEISHDQVTRFLSHKQFNSADLWKNVKKEIIGVNNWGQVKIKLLSIIHPMVHFISGGVKYAKITSC